MRDNMIRTNIHLPKPQKEALRKIAEEKDVPVAELIRRAIDEWMERQAKNDGGNDGHGNEQ